MNEKNLNMLLDYSKLMDISLNLILRTKRLEKDTMHYKKIIEILLTGKFSSKEYKKNIKQLYEKYTAEELAIIIFEKCVFQNMSPLRVLEALEAQGGR